MTRLWPIPLLLRFPASPRFPYTTSDVPGEVPMDRGDWGSLPAGALGAAWGTHPAPIWNPGELFGGMKSRNGGQSDSAKPPIWLKCYPNKIARLVLNGRRLKFFQLFHDDSISQSSLVWFCFFRFPDTLINLSLRILIFSAMITLRLFAIKGSSVNPKSNRSHGAKNLLATCLSLICVSRMKKVIKNGLNGNFKNPKSRRSHDARSFAATCLSLTRKSRKGNLSRCP